MAKERAAGGQGGRRREQKAPERHRWGVLGKGLEGMGIEPRALRTVDAGGHSIFYNLVPQKHPRQPCGPMPASDP